MSLLVISEMLELFLNRLSSDNKYSLRNRENIGESIQMELPKKPFLKYASNFEHFEKKISLIAYIFWKSCTAKDMVRKISKKPRFRIHFGSKHVKGSQILLKSVRGHFCHIFLSFWEKWSQKMSLSVISEILGLFLHTLTTDYKYSLTIK